MVQYERVVERRCWVHNIGTGRLPLFDSEDPSCLGKRHSSVESDGSKSLIQRYRGQAFDLLRQESQESGVVMLYLDAVGDRVAMCARF